MTDTVRRALGIDQVDLRGRMVMIEEQHGSDANFLVNTLLSHALEKGQGICLVLFHNTFGHYHNVGMKLGYNLNVLRERGEVTVLEPMKTFLQNIEELGHDAVDASTPELSEDFRKILKDNVIPDATKLDVHLVRHLFVALKTKYLEAAKVRESVTVIIDDLSHLFDFNLSLTDVWTYVRYLRSLMQFQPKMSVCIMTHTYRTNADSCQPDIIVIGLRRMAHLNVMVEPLSTGHANDISGKLTVIWTVASIRKKYHWPERMTYLYKLMDRQIKVFTPGAKEALS
ncbi:elongator complex protein 6 [Fopius arisanus]|uniref:Elongator complex protein 6 n=1 Tax=Fopius arisanus TaxID=64838 RepID=A0A0C9QP75_9HYME|nr:PREDICTED: elongator complex protein 6 [Fopius arisanus]